MPRDLSRFRIPHGNQPSFESAFEEDDYLPPEVARYLRRSRRPDVLRGAVAGALAGLAAGFVMVQLQNAWAESRNAFNHEVPKHRTEPERRQSGTEPEDATVRFAETVSESVFHHRLTQEEKKVAGPAVHYAFSAGVGALYGAATEVRPGSASGFGLPFGATLFLAADEVALPALGLEKGPTEVPLSKHVSGLASHLVFGAATELFRRGILRALKAA